MGRRALLILAVLVLVSICALAAAIMYEPAYAPIELPKQASFDASIRARGARVVALGDCAVCHTAQGGKPFAGGLPLLTPFGTIYATNITPDNETGIGSWSLEAFSRALRKGISRDGHQLYPAFPYIHFTRIPDQDIAAAYAYLMSRDPIHATAPHNKLIFPLNFRPLVAFWNLLFLKDERFTSDPRQSPEWNRGKLLVDGLGHCAACHSPLNLIGGEKTGHAFDGGLIDGWDAYPLNQLAHADIPWTKDQLVTYLRTGVASEHGGAAGPMLPVTRDLATVPEEDVQAIAQYILSIQKPGSSNDTTATVAGNDNHNARNISPGTVMFAAACASCHGEGSPMQSIGNRPALSVSTAVNAKTPRNMIQMMLGGISWHQAERVNYMPAFEGSLTETQMADIVAYVRATYSKKPAWAQPEKMVSDISKENAQR